MQTREEALASYQKWCELLRDFDARQNPDELRIAKVIASALNGEGGRERIGPYEWDRMHWVRRQVLIDAARAVLQALNT